MPPKGLYAVPRHHVYGGQMKRPSFNSNDFAVHGEEAVISMDGASSPRTEEPKKKKKKHSLSQGKGIDRDGDSKSEAKIKKKDRKDGETAIGEQSAKKEKKEKKGATTETPGSSKKHKKHKKQERAETKQVEKTAGTTPEQPKSPKKKRKRTSEVASLPMPSGVFGEGFADQIWAVINSAEAPTVPAVEPKDETERAKKKKKSSTRKSLDIPAYRPEPETAVEGDTPSALSQMSKKRRRKSDSAVNRGKDPELPTLKKTSVSDVSTKSGTPVKTSVKPKSAARTTSVSATSPKKTSIAHPRPYSSTAPPKPSTGILVPETPPSKNPQYWSNFSVTPVPFKLTSKASALISNINMSNPQMVTTAARSKTHVPLPSVPNALTDNNLIKHAQPQGEKSKPRAKSVSSVTSSMGSRSIKDMFARVGKRQDDPIVDQVVGTSEDNKKGASMETFYQKYLALQKTIVFPDENKYLKEFLAWISTHDVVPPCLGTVTGCTAKREELLRQSREGKKSMLKFLESEGIDTKAILQAGDRARKATDLLILSVRAELPVPIGVIEGTWTLYCPKYGETHCDRYGLQRKLQISSILGLKSRSAYRASLSLPPRTLAFPTLSFPMLPHASFRTTKTKTSSEGYAIEIIFLGNGYLHIRFDLKLLLTGKATEEADGKKIHMEFVGIHEQAVEWLP
ncbi:hypothetical protein P280DRAFT_545733 [Massarina eburnea CBS 473.64]|uniref:Uncharacterized protein n=1 Tax=Massarina eburnea CBS 473.64 TaxID=1395130 RepID=A0A6A6SEX7_9PLEO|nr:hypothetical protein P280DRAFT_545733 [Massarina eburnea CBS 473.64]